MTNLGVERIAKVKEIVSLPLTDLNLGTGQVRTRNTDKNLDSLVENIRTVGLLQPIVVCPRDDEDGYQVLAGQRRYFAHCELVDDHGLSEFETIACVVLDREVSEIDAKIISFAENDVRQDMERGDIVDVCRHFFHIYGTIGEVVRATGISRDRVSRFLKVENLPEEVRNAYNDGVISLKSALKALAACDPDDTGDVDPADIIGWAKTMDGLSDDEVTAIGKVFKSPKEDPSAVLERAKALETKRVTAILTGDAYEAFKRYTDDQELTTNLAATQIIEEGLTDQGYLDT